MVTDSTSIIAVLPPLVANQIAAGEVVERPASVIKELVENSIDAGATAITVRVEEAGKQCISVDDNGDGMSNIDASIAMQRHATSKIHCADDLHCIASHGFRGEALPSIASVSRFRLHTCLRANNEGIEIRIDDSGTLSSRPAAQRLGTHIEVRDLFLNTPARLQFMRSNKTEEAAMVEVIRALALANPSLSLALYFDDRKRISFSSQSEAQRINAVMGREFESNSHQQQLEHDGIHINATLGLPTFHHRNSLRMWFLLNGRVIRDKLLIAALRAGYRDVMFHDRYPVAVIQINMDPAQVDINVHPAKREVRFANPGAVRSAIVAAVRTALESMGSRSSSTTTSDTIKAMRPAPSNPATPSSAGSTPQPPAPHHPPTNNAIGRLLFSTPSPAAHNAASHETNEPTDTTYHTEGTNENEALRFGVPLAQIHQRYLLTQTNNGVILIDQHAAHERITYETFKQQLRQQQVVSQPLLIAEQWHASPDLAAWLHDHPDILTPFGVDIDPIDDENFTIRAIPSLLGKGSPLELVAELAESIQLIGDHQEGLSRVLERWLGNRACKSSITSGQTLTHEAQLALLEQMNSTPNIAQCNHGRPTWVALTLNDLDRLFGRQG